jgi:LytR cell envelope-related transcriptional attenuator
MNQGNSSGLPLRAIVMVLLFLGVVFLLVGFQALGSDNSDDSDQSTIAATSTATSSPSPSPSPAAARPEVRVFNISTVQGAAEGTATRLRDANWNVVETGNLELPNVTATTVFFTDAPGEKEAADEVGRLLQAPVAPRVPELSEVPPGLVVVVTG